MKKIFKILGVFVCVICLIILAKIFQDLIYSASSVTCLESKLEDTLSFGKALAINDNYIAVGDPVANRVAVYSYDNSKDKWSRTREIYPPKYSVVDKVGYGFGYSLAFNKNQLIIGTYSEPEPNDLGDETEKNEFNNEYHGAVYSLLLDENNKNSFQEIVLPQSVRLSGYAVTIFNNKIALGATTEAEPYIKPGKILLVNPTTLQVETAISPPNSEKRFTDFGLVIDSSNKSLLIGSRGLSRRGGALLFDQAGKIEKISLVKDPTNPSLIAGSSVSLTNDLMAVGSSGSWGDENTLLLRRTTEGWSLIDVVRFGGSLDATESHVLISASQSYGMPTLAYHTVHMLVKLDENKAKIASKIRWQLSKDFQIESKGIIYDDLLLLSHKGKVVLLSMKSLPSSYVINQSFCEEK